MKTIFDFNEKKIFEKTLFGFLPRTVAISSDLGHGAKNFSLVREGDFVKEGDVIFKNSSGLKFHSPIPGVVSEISKIETSTARESLAVKIFLSGKFNFLGKNLPKIDWKTKSSQQILEDFSEKGLVQTFSECVSLKAEIERALKRERSPILVIRLFDDDPGRSVESFVAKNFWDEVCEGAAILQKASLASEVVFVFDEKFEKSPNESLFSSKILRVAADTKKYPFGTKEQIIKTVKTSFPQLKITKNDLFFESLTCFAVFEAIAKGIPLLTRFIHIGGECLKSEAIIKAQIGTYIEDLVWQCGGFIKNPQKIVVNGKILGVSLSSVKIPVTKNIKSILFLGKKSAPDIRTSACIRCGNCRKYCPENLEVDSIFRALTKPNQIPENQKKLLLNTIFLCSECALCNAVCPARLPLFQTICTKKRILNELEEKNEKK